MRMNLFYLKNVTLSDHEKYHLIYDILPILLNSAKLFVI
jgi:hypothetical protein